jgi:exonuclease VII small subunit
MNQKEKQWLKDFFHVQSDLLHDINSGILLADSVAWHISQYRENFTNHRQQQLGEVQQYVLEEAVPALETCSKKLRAGSRKLEQHHKHLQRILETPASPSNTHLPD